tara:strand:+ start:183 stop:413 length:231 start_codon:yes stop_codon:yes gene_type:complete
MLFVVIFGTGNWVPSYSFLYVVLIVGALLTAGVAMSAFSFYDDYYWGDEDFRDQLRFHPSNRNSFNQRIRRMADKS